MKTINKILITALIVGISTNSSCYANDVINVLDSMLKTIPKNTTYKPQVPKTITPENININTNTTSTTTNISTFAPKEETDAILEKYKKDAEYKVSVYSTNPSLKAVSTMEATQLIASQNDGVASSYVPLADKTQGKIELPWYNNNTIVWNTAINTKSGTYYSQEADKNRNDVGFVVIVDKYKSLTFFEYLRTDSFEMKLSTILIYELEQDTTFLYDSDKKLLAYKYGDKVEILDNAVVKNANFLNQINPLLQKYTK